MTYLNISTSTVPNTADTPSLDQTSNPSVLIPSQAAWYHPEKIHDIERRAFPDLLSQNESDTSTYLSTRQFMVSTYRARPKEYLSVAFCRRMLPLDVGSLFKIHAFLEQWGLINYEVNTKLDLNNTGGNVGLVYPKGRPVHSDLLPPPDTHQNKMCRQCKGECLKSFYGLTKSSENGILCEVCFASGKLIGGTSSQDYVHVELPITRIEQKWTEEEELKLLEAIETHGNDWNKISEQTGKPKEACVMHFLSLDCGTEDSLNDISTMKNPSVSPFTNLENPVIGTVAFLASLVNPKLAATAAKAAIAALSNDISKQDEAAVSVFALAAAKAHEMAKEEAETIEHLRDAILLAQMKKVQLKMTLLESLEKNVLEEKAELEKQRMVLFLERVNIKKAIMGMEGKFVSADGNKQKEHLDVEMHVISDNTR